MHSLDFTVVICTYNGEERLPSVLERLQSQINTENLNWEIVIVDNNSTDNTKQIIEAHQKNWRQAYPLQYVFEPEQGLAFARQRAIREAKSSLVGFLDDDTLPAEDWVAVAHAFALTHPKAGAYGGQIHGDYEVEPPPDFRKVAIFLAIVERGAKPYRYEPQKRVLPPGAGLVVRKDAWLNSVPSRTFLIGRTGKSKLASEDIEQIIHLQLAGWEIWYNPEMHLYHQIPKWRMERTYLIKVVQGMGLARHHIRMIRLKPWHRPIAFPAFLANDFLKLILHWLKYQQLLKTDLAAACEMQLLISSLISPFYLWNYQLRAKSQQSCRR